MTCYCWEKERKPEELLSNEHKWVNIRYLGDFLAPGVSFWQFYGTEQIA